MTDRNKLMKIEIIEGKIWLGSDGDNYSATMIGYNSEPFAKRFDNIAGWGNKKVSVRYWITDEPKSKKELLIDNVKQLAGAIESSYYHRYSDYTGYLWTEQKAKVGGHNLLAEVSSKVGKFLYLEIEVHGK